MSEIMQRGETAPDAVMRLAGGDTSFLAPHHIEASRKLCRLFERASLRQRVTMSYDPARVGGRSGVSIQGDVADSAADARRMLGTLAGRMPSDCWNVLADVCGFEKGLQQIETERQWPRRSAKLVLRIGLEQLAALFGLSANAEGRPTGSQKSWLAERPAMFADDPA